MSTNNIQQDNIEIDQIASEQRFSVPLLNQDYQAKFHKDSKYPHHKQLVMINVAQILCVLFFILEVVQWKNGYVYSYSSSVETFIITTCLYGLSVLCGTFYIYIQVLGSNKQNHQMNKIRSIFDKLRTLGIRIRFYIRCYHNSPSIFQSRGQQITTHRRQRIVPLTECKDITGFFPERIEQRFKKPYVIVSFKLEEEYKEPQQKQLLQTMFQNFIQANKRDRYQQTKKILEYEKMDQKYQNLVYQNYKSGCLKFCMVISFISSVLCISYPFNFILDKIFIQRYNINIVKMIKLDRIRT